jgi:2-iminobutanoate/2-iminopropanoate deaminase
MDIIFTGKACPPKGHYHQAVRHNGILYLSGILGITPAGDAVSGGMVEEAKQVFANLTEVLKAGSSGIDKLLKVTIFIADMDSWGEVNKMYAELLNEHKCARSIVPCAARLPFGLNMELEATAISE